MQSSRTRRFATIFGTFAIALGIGFVMQNGDALASRLGVNGKADIIGSGDAQQPVSASGMIAPMSGGSASEADSLVPNMNVPADDQGAASGCEITFEAAPSAAATVDLLLSAPCHPESLVTVQHQGMKFNEMTNANGLLAVQVPALSKEAYFVATVEGTAGVVAITGVQSLDLYDRAVLQWRSNDLLEIQALEDGDAGDSGQGFTTRLGNANSAVPLMVEVYSYPSGMSDTDTDVTLSVNAEVTLANCGRQINAQSIQLQPNQPLAARNMSLNMPSCDQIGEFLVLKNMFEDLTLASR